MKKVKNAITPDKLVQSTHITPKQRGDPRTYRAPRTELIPSNLLAAAGKPKEDVLEIPRELQQKVDDDSELQSLSPTLDKIRKDINTTKAKKTSISKKIDTTASRAKAIELIKEKKATNATWNGKVFRINGTFATAVDVIRLLDPNNNNY
jgi:hypothetical protein